MKLKNYEIENEKVSLQDINRIAKESNQIYEENCVASVLFDKKINFSKKK